MKEFTLLGTRVLVKQKEIEQQSQGGILLPTASQAKPLEGTVMAIGEELKVLDPFPFKLNGRDKILFDHFAGTEIKLDEETFLIMDIEDVILIFKE